MRTFIQFDRKGKIRSVIRLPELPEGVEHPFGELAEGESVIELDPEAPTSYVPVAELSENWTVSPRTRKLNRKRRTGRNGETRS
jgi:hypothetical protein